MSVNLTANFFANARGFTFLDGGGLTWSINKNTNAITATGSGGGVLSSVGLADTSTTPIYAVTNSPLTANGTIDLTLVTQLANAVFAGPTTGAATQPTFRGLVATDIPALAYVTSVGLAEGSTSPIYTITGSPVTGSGTLTFTLKSQNQGLFLAAPASSAGQPTFRAIVASDIGQLGANPTAKVALAAVNGSASTFMRSDGAPALDVTISPTWTGNHTFTPGSGRAISINAAANAFGFQLIASSTSGQSFGALIEAGTISTDRCVRFMNQAATAGFLEIWGDGHGTLGPSITSGLSWTAAGAMTMSSTFAINNGTPTAALSGFGSPSGSVTSGLTNAATLAQTAGTLAALLAYLKTIGFIAA